MSSWPPTQPRKRKARRHDARRHRLRTLLHQPTVPPSPPAMWSSCTCIVVPLSPLLSDCDQEIDPDRWCSHSAWGQECWQLIAQWVPEPEALELGHQVEPTPLRITEFAPAIPEHREQAAASPAPASGSAPPTPATRLGKRGACTRAMTYLSSPMGRSVVQQGSCSLPRNSEERADGSLRIVYAASIRSCRPCPLRERCQWNGGATAKPEPA